MSLNDHFDRIFCINLDRATDRWAHVQEQCQKHGFTVERFRAYDYKDYEGMPSGHRLSMSNAMCGCTNSHGLLLGHVAACGYNRVLILEDDFEVIHDDFNARFEAMFPLVPENWDLIYLGAHYGDKPLGRVNANVIRAGYIKTTSSYAITGKYARTLAPLIHGSGGTDDLISGFNPYYNVFVFQPRLMVQYNCMSYIWHKQTNNSACMMDTRHENMV